MKIELSPGEWAGVLNAVIERGELDDDREASDDYMRIAGLIREQIAEAGRVLPELPEPDEDQDEAECPHAWTASEVLAMRDQDAVYNAKGRELHGDAWHEFTRSYPEVGATCGAVLELVDRVPDYRSVRWEDGVLVVGDGQFGDAETEELSCKNGHQWSLAIEMEYR
jgi:hypothetical protein